MESAVQKETFNSDIEGLYKQQTLIDWIKDSLIAVFPLNPGGGNGKHRDILTYVNKFKINKSVLFHENSEPRVRVSAREEKDNETSIPNLWAS